MKSTTESESQVRLRGFASATLARWSERTGMSEACIAEEVIGAAFHRIAGKDELRSVRAWLDKRAEHWAAVLAEEAEHVRRRAEFAKLRDEMQKGTK